MATALDSQSKLEVAEARQISLGKSTLEPCEEALLQVLLQEQQEQYVQFEQRIESLLKMQEQRMYVVVQRALKGLIDNEPSGSHGCQSCSTAQLARPPEPSENKELELGQQETVLVQAIQAQHLRHEQRIESLFWLHEQRMQGVVQRALLDAELNNLVTSLENRNSDLQLQAAGAAQPGDCPRPPDEVPNAYPPAQREHVDSTGCKTMFELPSSLPSTPRMIGSMRSNGSELKERDSLPYIPHADHKLPSSLHLGKTAKGNREDPEPKKPKNKRHVSMAARTTSTATLSPSNDNYKQLLGPIENLGRVQRLSLKLLGWKHFDHIVTLLIMVNAVIIGAQVDWAVRNINEKTPTEFRALDIFFTVVFAVELVLRVTAEQKAFLRSSNPHLSWNLFDAAVVLSAVIEEIMLLLSSKVLSTQAVRTLRVLKLIRLLRIIRVCRFFADLRTMVNGIMSTFKSLFWAAVLLCLLMYMFSICLLQIMAGEFQESTMYGKENRAEEEDVLMEYFGSLARCFYTLHKSLFGGLDWGSATDPMNVVSHLAVLFFLAYVSFCMLCVLNIVTGVFVENASKITNRDENHMIMEELDRRKMWFEEVKHLFGAVDVDRSGSVTLPEFLTVCSDIKVKALMRKMGVDVSGDRIESLFTMLDFDGDGTVDVDEFVLGMQEIHGNATALDMVKLRYQNKTLMKEIKELTSFCKVMFNEQRKRIHHLAAR